MKKLFVLILASGIAFCAYPQKEYKSDKAFAQVPSEHTAVAFDKPPAPIEPHEAKLKDGKAAMIDRYEIGKSGNIYSVLTSYQRGLAYDPVSGALLATFRSDPNAYPGTTSSTIMSHTSPDMGPTWDHLIIINPNPAEHACRYPSGVLYNHDGMSSYDNVYATATGPSHTNGTWDYTYFASIMLDGSNQNSGYTPWSGENDWARSSMTTVPGAVYIFGSSYTDVGNLGFGQTMKQYVYTTDDPVNGFTLETVNSFEPDWLIDPSDGHACALYTTWSAWSLDGSIGYMWMIGVTNETYDYGVYQPQLAYSTDAGTTWTGISLNLEDHPTLADYLPPYEDAGGIPQTVRPSFLTADRTYPGVVDYEGNLHLFSNVYGSSRGDVLDPDNGYWVVNDQFGGHIFDFIINQDGLVDIIFVDSVRTDVAPDNSFGDVSWDHRLQASKSPDEQAVFCVWAEDTDESHQELLNPDIKGWGYEVGLEVLDIMNFTEDDLYAGFYFFHYLAEISPKEGQLYNLPISASLSITEFNTNDPLASVTHYYLGGCAFVRSGILDSSPNNSKAFGISQNIPNPASNHTSFNIISSAAAPVKVEVSNMIGQTVVTVHPGIINGSMKVSIDVSKFEAGVYFYTVTIDNQRVSKKMIVR